MLLRTTFTLTFLAFAAHAQDVSDCNWVASPEYIAHPETESVKNFANDSITVTHLNTDGEPACCSSYIMVEMQHPQKGAICKLVTNSNAQHSSPTGFAQVLFDKIGADYDASQGLFVEIPVKYLDQSGALEQDTSMVLIVINQKDGIIRASTIGD